MIRITEIDGVPLSFIERKFVEFIAPKIAKEISYKTRDLIGSATPLRYDHPAWGLGLRLFRYGREKARLEFKVKHWEASARYSHEIKGPEDVANLHKLAPRIRIRKTPREIVAGHLCDLGFSVSAEDIVSVRGYWSHLHQDVTHRWTLRARLNDKMVDLTGMHSVKECVGGLWCWPNDERRDFDGDYLVASSRIKRPTTALEKKVPKSCCNFSEDAI